MTTRRLLAVIAFLSGLWLTVVVAPAEGAGGPPIPGDAGFGGVVDPAKGIRYVTFNAGSRTVVARVAINGGQLRGYTFVRRSYTIPAVAMDFSAAGLSHDGRTLVLAKPRAVFPQSRTRFAVLDARRLRLRERLSLRGNYGFDAISPDGRFIYLIEYQSRRDPSRYAVRAYDLAAKRMFPRPVIDPREPEEKMRGFPMTRATSPDGRWAYTLYDGAGKHPFIHALDTVERTAACIDLDALAGYRRVYALRLALSGDAHRLAVTDRGRALAVVDTRTFQVSEPPGGDDTNGTGALVLVVFGATALLLGAGALKLAFRRRRLATT